MIEAFATVINQTNGIAKVEYTRSSACGHCEHQSGCSIKSEGESKQQIIEIPCNLNLTIGQQVRIGIPETNLVRGAFLAYMIPLIGVLIGAVIGSLLDSEQQESMAIFGAFAGGCIGFFTLKLLSSSKRMVHYQPVILGEIIPVSHHV